MKLKTRKLSLHRETLTRLDDRHLSRAAAAIATSPVICPKTDSCFASCPPACTRNTNCF